MKKPYIRAFCVVSDLALALQSGLACRLHLLRWYCRACFWLHQKLFYLDSLPLSHLLPTEYPVDCWKAQYHHYRNCLTGWFYFLLLQNTDHWIVQTKHPFQIIWFFDHPSFLKSILNYTLVGLHEDGRGLLHFAQVAECDCRYFWLKNIKEQHLRGLP